jgi:predicted metal-dependent hydrolase
MSVKKKKVEEIIRNCAPQGVDPHYAAYFECFNSGLFYEAHDVLEQLWLPRRKAPDGDFYKGLIQLAGAFVHLQKGRNAPAAALFTLAAANLSKYPSPHENLDLNAISALIQTWQLKIERATTPFAPDDLKPQILLGRARSPSAPRHPESPPQ